VINIIFLYKCISDSRTSTERFVPRSDSACCDMALHKEKRLPKLNARSGGEMSRV